MFRKIFYGNRPALNQHDHSLFNRGKYECVTLFQTNKCQPVAISRCTDADLPIWKVEYGFSCIVFGTYDEAVAFCRGRFCTLDGKKA